MVGINTHHTPAKKTNVGWATFAHQSTKKAHPCGANQPYRAVACLFSTRQFLQALPAEHPYDHLHVQT